MLDFTNKKQIGVKEVRTLIKNNKIRKIAILNSDFLTRAAKNEALAYLLKQEDFLKQYLKVDMDKIKISTKKYYVNKKDRYCDGIMPTKHFSKIGRIPALLDNGWGGYVKQSYYPLINVALEDYIKQKQKDFIRGLRTREQNLEKAFYTFKKITGVKDEWYSIISYEKYAKQYGYKSLQQVYAAARRYKKTEEYKKLRKERLFNYLYSKIFEKYGYSIGDYIYLREETRDEIKKEMCQKEKNYKKYGKFLADKDIRSVKNVQGGHDGFCIFLDTLAAVSYDFDEDWDYYSKSWHKQHGPKKTVVNRRVTFYKKGMAPKTIYLDNFRGDFILKAYKEAFKIRKTHYKDTKKKRIQLDAHFKVKKIKELCGIEIYTRIINNCVYDYVAYYNKTTYHAFTKKEAITGLKNKVNKKYKTDKELLDYKEAKKYGFCDAGIKSFCETNGLNCDSSYTRAELKKKVAENKEKNKPFIAELTKIGII